MKAERDILFTFDYELYLGSKSGTFEKCMLEPGEALRALLEKYQATGIFFVDTLGLLKAGGESGLQQQVRQVNDQLKSLHAAGHYIFPHLHPHWLDSKYNPQTRQFDLGELSRYSAASLPVHIVSELMANSIAYLRSLGIDHRQWGYRAGGWCIQPFSRYRAIFEAQKISSEFSVLPGYRNDNTSQYFDFSKVQMCEPYKFSQEVETPDPRGHFVEYPISRIETAGRSLRRRLLLKYLWRKGDRGWGDGLSAQTTALKSDIAGYEMVSIDMLTADKLSAYKQFLHANRYMHWISHPKMLTRHGLGQFGKFLTFAVSKYRCNFDYRNCHPIN
jgi:hypothetical protein